MPTGKENKAILASMQASRAALGRLHQIRDDKKKAWIDEFVDQITKEPQAIKTELAPFEKAVARASDALALGKNLRFTTAIKYLRKEIFAHGTDAWNAKYYEELLLVVLEIFQDELAWALHIYEEKQDLKDWLDNMHVARTTNILEEARVTDFFEASEYE